MDLPCRYLCVTSDFSDGCVCLLTLFVYYSGQHAYKDVQLTGQLGQFTGQFGQT